MHSKIVLAIMTFAALAALPGAAYADGECGRAYVVGGETDTSAIGLPPGAIGSAYYIDYASDLSGFEGLYEESNGVANLQDTPRITKYVGCDVELLVYEADTLILS